MIENVKEDGGQPPGIDGKPRGVAPTYHRRMSFSDIVHRFKSFATHLYSKGVKEHWWVPFPCRLWGEDEENPYKIGNSQSLASPNSKGHATLSTR